MSIQLQFNLDPHKWPYWIKISDYIYLGSMPLKNWGHIEEIKALGVTAILSLNKKHEFLNQPFTQPVQPTDWNDKNVEFFRISTPDLEPLKIKKLSAAVEYVAKQVSLGKKVYIHCNGGRGRSVIATIASLIKTHHFSLEEALHYVMKQRKQATLSPQQIETLVKWHVSRH